MQPEKHTKAKKVWGHVLSGRRKLEASISNPSINKIEKTHMN
jgi:hypothetical protein